MGNSMLTITRRIPFEAGHRVYGHESVCASLHGHSYVAHITVTAPELDRLGRVVDFSVIKEKVKSWIDANWDHNVILHPDDPMNLVLRQKLTVDDKNVVKQYDRPCDKIPYQLTMPGIPEAVALNPTAENLAKCLAYIADKLFQDDPDTKGIRVLSVRMEETENCSATYDMPVRASGKPLTGVSVIDDPATKSHWVQHWVQFDKQVKETAQSLRKEKTKPLPVINQQPAEKVTSLSELPDGTLDVVDIWSTIQGEGPDAGTPAVFIRLAGCNLQCPACDTDYTTNRHYKTVSEIEGTVDGLWDSVRDCRKKMPELPLVVLTGGEPFRQNISKLLERLLPKYRVQIETNGTLCPNWLIGPLGNNTNLSIVCSPKARIHSNLLSFVNAWKFVVRAGKLNTDGLPSAVLGNECMVNSGQPESLLVVARWKGQDVYLQPEDNPDPEQFAANVAACVESCQKHGYKISIQTHKIMGVK